MYRYFCEDKSYALLQREVLSVKLYNFIKIVTDSFKKIVVIYPGAHVKGPFFELEYSY
jgi:hypothetical protein